METFAFSIENINIEEVNSVCELIKDTIDRKFDPIEKSLYLSFETQDKCTEAINQIHTMNLTVEDRYSISIPIELNKKSISLKQFSEKIQETYKGHKTIVTTKSEIFILDDESLVSYVKDMLKYNKYRTVTQNTHDVSNYYYYYDESVDFFSNNSQKLTKLMQEAGYKM